MSKFGESGEIIVSLKVSKNYFNQFMDKNAVIYVINGVNLVKIGHSWLIWSKLGHFGDQNDVIGPNIRVGRNYFVLKLSQELF